VSDPGRIPTLDELERFYASDEVEKRRAVVEALREHETPRTEGARALLLRTLGDAEWRVRREALQLALTWTTGAGGRELQSALVDAIAQGENVGLRNAALEVLATRGSAARPLLEAALARVGTGTAAKFFVEALGATRDREAVKVLVPLVSIDDANLSAAAVGALAHLGGPDAEHALLSVLDSDDPFRRLAALDGLGQLGARVPYDVLAPLIDDRVVRRAAIPLLGRSGSEKAVEPLVALLRGSGSATTMARLAEALADLAHTVGDAALRPRLEGVGPKLRRLVVESEAAGRRAAAHLLVVLQDEEGLAEVAALAARDELLPETLVALERWGEGAVLPLLQVARDAVGLTKARALDLAAALTTTEAPADLRHATLTAVREAARSEDAALRAIALRALAPHAVVGDIQWLIGVALRDEGAAPSAVAALQTLFEREPQAIAEALQETSLEHEGTRVAGLAARALGPEVLDELQAGLSSNRASHRAAVVLALAEIADPRAAAMAALALMDDDARVRETAARVLGGIRDASGVAVGVEALVAALGSEDDSLCATAATALGDVGSVGDDAVVRALLTAVQSGGPLTAAASLGALERLAPSALEGLLDEAIASPEPAIAERAVGVAASLGGDAVVRRLTGGLDHPVWHVRAAAARWLGQRAEPAAREALLARRAVEDDGSVRGAIADALESIDG